MTNLPSTVRIGVVPYAVDVREHVEINGQQHFGKIDYRAHTIAIWSGLPKERQFVTLLHEAIHAIEADRGLELEEREVDALAKGLASFLIDNGFVASKETR